MRFEDTKIIDPYVDLGLTSKIQLYTSTQEDQLKLEQALNIKLPNGYEDYVTTLGRGLYCSHVRVFPPSYILDNLQRKKDFLDQYWFWDQGENAISKEQALECIHLAETMNGDQIIFDPSELGGLYSLPRHDDFNYRIGNDFYDALDWLWRNQPGPKEITGYPDIRYFVPENPLVFTHGWKAPKTFERI